MSDDPPLSEPAENDPVPESSSDTEVAADTEEEEEEASPGPKQPTVESVPDPGIPEWVVTFGDMMTLLLCFFILLFAMSDIKLDKAKLLVESLETSHFGIHKVDEAGKRLGLDMLKDPGKDMPKMTEVDELGGNTKPQFSEVKDEITRFIMANRLAGDVSFGVDGRGAVITLTNSLLFDKGKATINSNAEFVLQKVGDIIRQVDYLVRVEGHTDNIEPPSVRYPTNWELSSSRAAQVVQFFIEKGISPRRLSAEGFASYRPVTTNATARGRRTNRRVEIIYARESFEQRWRRLHPSS